MEIVKRKDFKIVIDMDMAYLYDYCLVYFKYD